MHIRRVRLAAFASWFLAGTSISYAQDATVSINNSGSFTTHEIAVDSGGSFTVDINVDAVDEIFDVWGMHLVASASGIFEATSGTYQAPWDSYAAFPVGALNPSSLQFQVALPSPLMFGPGQTALIRVEVAVPLSAPSGVYTLNIQGANLTSCRECPAFSTALIGPDFVVNVTAAIPTVSEWGFLVLAIGLMVTGTCLVRRRFSIHVDGAA